MTHDLTHTLDRASAALRRSVETVRRTPPAVTVPPIPPPHTSSVDHATLRPRRADSAVDQSIAALQAVVWIASFVQSVFNEIRGRSDEL